MKLSKNSWHARLNTYIFGEYYTRSVDCLCPYFWGTILAILCLPLWLIGHGIGYIIENFPETGWHAPKLNMSYDTKQKIGNIVGYGFLVFIAVIAIIGLTMAIIEYGIIHVVFWIGIGIGFICGFIVFASAMFWIKEKYDDWRSDHPKEHKPNLLVEFIKAKKNKHCPLITWEEE